MFRYLTCFIMFVTVAFSNNEIYKIIDKCNKTKDISSCVITYRYLIEKKDLDLAFRVAQGLCIEKEECGFLATFIMENQDTVPLDKIINNRNFNIEKSLENSLLKNSYRYKGDLKDNISNIYFKLFYTFDGVELLKLGKDNYNTAILLYEYRIKKYEETKNKFYLESALIPLLLSDDNNPYLEGQYDKKSKIKLETKRILKDIMFK
ncbi:hypothetical protein CFT13S00388_02580 [Campylobacter fetus subsp. testudinum]|uniref:hypothetical protein n=1 Tax=Campylobacter fetus TaxID=196 RepID=UPI000818AC37|nr:hypothetical protein [Campylobacter fetus]OCR88071.1 hypothetical protein CFT13S00388_02580 [Campylobacter fetus subsp. testudinum]